MPASRIEHVVIIVKENHGFDTYFGKFPGAAGDSTLPAAGNPPAVDPTHTHQAWLKRATNAVREQYDKPDIPAYWAYASQFTLCDHYFTDVAGPSTPNHLMLIAGDSPFINNPPGGYRTTPGQAVDLPSLPAQLELAGLTWGNYGGYAFDFVKALVGKNKFASAQFVQDAQAGKLPSVSWVYADHANSEHPPDSAADRAGGVGNVTNGMNWTVAQVEAIVAGGLWPKVVIFITWDDWGGWADHVDPPEVEKWSDGTQFRYGNRVPCLVLSPWAKPGHISTTVRSHVSLIRFCETTFGLPPVTPRTAAADDMGDCFDSAQKPLPAPQANEPAPAPPEPPTPTPPPEPPPPPPPPPLHVLHSIHDSAARAEARIAAAQAATDPKVVARELRNAAKDLAAITRLSTPGSA
jgi:phospholipase C